MNDEFNIPYYIFESIITYIENGRSIIEWENIRVLLRVAKLNNRLNEDQISYLEQKYK